MLFSRDIQKAIDTANVLTWANEFRPRIEGVIRDASVSETIEKLVELGQRIEAYLPWTYFAFWHVRGEGFDDAIVDAMLTISKQEYA